MNKMVLVALLYYPCPCGNMRHYRVVFSDRSLVSICHHCGAKEAWKPEPKKLLTLMK